MADLVRLWWEKAEDSLRAAEREHAAGAETFAINRLYYAAFYAVTAWLQQGGKTFSKHSTARAAFHRDLVKAGVVSREWSSFYDRLFEDRAEGDYKPAVSFSPDYVAERLTQCRLFLTDLRQHVAF